jgi:hypothetical protein
MQQPEREGESDHQQRLPLALFWGDKNQSGGLPMAAPRFDFGVLRQFRTEDRRLERGQSPMQQAREAPERLP